MNDAPTHYVLKLQRTPDDLFFSHAITNGQPIRGHANAVDLMNMLNNQRPGDADYEWVTAHSCDGDCA